MLSENLLRYFIVVLLWLLSSSIKAEQITSANAHWPPWRVIQADGSITGVEIDILDRLTSHLNLTLSAKGCGWKRCLKHMEVGESDMMIGLFKTPEREQYMTFISPPYRIENNICFYQKSDQQININRFEDLHALTVGVVNKVVYFEKFDRDERINKFNAITDEALFRLLRANKIDTVIMACVAGDIFIKNAGFEGEFKHANYVNHVASPVYIAVSKKSPLLARIVDISQVLRSMVDDGEIKQIMSEYGVVPLKLGSFNTE